MLFKSMDCSLIKKNLFIIWLYNLSTLNVPDEGYSRNVLFTLNYVSNVFSFYYIHMYVFGNCAYMYTRKEGWDSINQYNPAMFTVQTRTCICNAM